MTKLTLASVLFSALTLVSLTDLSNASATSVQSVKDTSTYYTARRDFRRCMFPACSGWWVKAVNSRQTTCADGSKADECYVAELSLPSGVSLEDGDLFHGQLSERTYPGFSTDYGVMDADDVYSPVLPSQPSRGKYNLVYDNGIRCFTTPCDSTTIAQLNSNKSWTNRSYYFWGATAAEDEKLEEAFQAEYTLPVNHGALAFGTFYRFWGVRYLEINNVYVTKQVASGPQAGELGGFCGGIAAFQCNDGLVCQLDGNYPDAGGICVNGPAAGELGGFCGGIAGLPCNPDLRCELDGAYPDAGGICVEETICEGDENLAYVATTQEMCQLVRYTCVSMQGFNNDCGCGCCPVSVVVDCKGLNATDCAASGPYYKTREDLDRYGCTDTELIGAL